MERIDEITRRFKTTQDVNLHIKTQGYEDGEEVEVRLESSLDKVFSVSGIIQDNQIMITNPFKEQ
ncbi:hypothetical protein NHP164001_21040 [Helicobacter trogontum]|uniref:Uncharacterized protein n=1 Tax=Helicobacter trogontum TaxID=50960 RepID=A0ABQ0D6W1_9HELI